MVKVFIDESGDLGEKGSKYFIISALIINDEKPFKRLIKNMRRNKFKKELKKANELKATKSSVEVINYLLKQLLPIKFSATAVVMLKEKNYSTYLSEHKDKFYNFVSGKLARNLNVLQEKDLEIYIDKSKRKNELRTDFDQYFSRNLKEVGFCGNLKIKHSYSHSYDCLQIIDFISWAVFQKFEHNNENYLELIKTKLEIIQFWN